MAFVHLVQEARILLDFLALVDDHPSLYSGPILNNAIRRYEVFWLPLAAKQGSDSRLLAAPLDIAWVWHLHMLSPQDYEQDCLNIVSQVVDHKPMNRYQRIHGLQSARYLWEVTYPSEPFEVELTQPTQFFMPYLLKIRYDIVKASHTQSKFYYQVSLPHFSDTRFLVSASERYDRHLQLKSQHPDVPMVPCIDVELMWHAHLQHPLNFKQEMTEIFGAMLSPDIHEASFRLGSRSHDSVANVWSAAGFQYDKSGTVYRGGPPQPRPSRPDGFYASLGRLQYVMTIRKVEVLNVDITKTFYVRLHNSAGTLLLQQKIKGGAGVDIGVPCVLDNDKLHTVTVTLSQKTFLGEREIGSSKTSLLWYLDTCPYGGTASELPWNLDVTVGATHSVVRMATQLSPPIIEGYRFKVQPVIDFAKYSHPSFLLSSPQSMLSPTHFAKTYLRCESATHTLLDCRGRVSFKCRVLHSTAAALSAVEIISVYGVVVASSHTINPNILPDKGSIDDRDRCVYLSQMEGERAMLIRGRKDWGVCVGKWQKGKMFHRSAGHVLITFFKLKDTAAARGWCEVRRYQGGLYLIVLDPNVFVYVDLKRGLFVMSPSAHDVPEIIALAFSVSILYILCKPYTPSPASESAPSLHKKAGKDKVTPMLLAAGYKSATVPSNVYLLPITLGSNGSGPLLHGAGSYDLDTEAGPFWNTELVLRSQEGHLWYTMGDVPYPTEFGDGGKGGSSRSSGGWFGGGGGGDGGGGDGGGGDGGGGGFGGGGGDGGGGGC